MTGPATGGAVRACVGLGANLGDAADSVRAAAAALDALPRTRLLALSRLYRTPAWGREDQPDFINAAACVETTLAPSALLQALLEIELAFGRQRDPGDRWGPRTLDLDLLLYGDQVLDLPGLEVPHPRLHERAFALVPLAEIAADAVVPGHGTVHDVLGRIETGAIVPLG
ncbi:2-amino-4-hydroxy-6-hydroxymethyldihydropteridine diphosphokinase [Xanthomonas sp. XNM01]|uniref:2-amino-4-hydroxy-6- hydroxymethyldihydropteridine diphosphokinase n=1 Tax=Xanthomonas sp. XNM01 TaxID=2769289 RepID=UPI00177CD2E0|nr:2-amino-4-hydroxy-6-hydroxymethyldihydropteridine diphosphokinase [Xanthomonas sp. XNM01]MBD9367689.1 2-amino-4-hydroxy-6-hydroxymethyldihydropteridine diphosphokinase [Xanthomonas sp. XNM01]